MLDMRSLARVPVIVGERGTKTAHDPLNVHPQVDQSCTGGA